MATVEGMFAPKANDIVRLQQREHAVRVYDKDVFKHAETDVEDGQPDEKGKRSRTKVKLRYAVDQQFLFAVFADNPHLHGRDRDEWEHLARTALEKYLATHERLVKAGPMHEPGNSYNLMVETNLPIEISAAHTRANREYEERKAAAEIAERLDAGDTSVLSAIAALIKGKG